MDIEKIIKELIEKITKDNKLLESFKKDGIKTVKNLLKIDLSEDQVKTIVKGISAKIKLDNAQDLLKGAGDLLGKLKK